MSTLDETIAAGPFRADWDSLTAYQVPAWYQNGKFGIFIHWGAYSVPAWGNEWYPRNMYQQGSPEFAHHVVTYGPQAQWGYKNFIPQFTGSQFDADRWAALFREAATRFVVPVAEHHDGFAMYDCSFGAWAATKMGPHRDIIGELATAVRAQNMVFGISSHRAEHWWFFDGGRTFPSDVQNEQNAGCMHLPSRHQQITMIPTIPMAQIKRFSMIGWRARRSWWINTSHNLCGSTGGSSMPPSRRTCHALPRIITTALHSGSRVLRSTINGRHSRKDLLCSTSSAGR